MHSSPTVITMDERMLCDVTQLFGALVLSDPIRVQRTNNMYRDKQTCGHMLEATRVISVVPYRALPVVHRRRH